MKCVIVEDEYAAAVSLSDLIRENVPDMEISAVLQSVEESVEWFGSNPAPDIAFMDIHLADGSSFSIFSKANISCPVVFTTAYDQYALRAFEVNSIDYLLKPVSKEHLLRAVDKYRRLTASGKESGMNPDLMKRLIDGIRTGRGRRSALLIPSGDKLVPLPVKEIAYIYTENKIVRIVCNDGREMYVDHTLDELSSMLDTGSFYRANRQYIVSRSAVKDISLWFNGRLSVNLTVKTPEKIVVSRANAADFKRWISE